MIFVAGSLAYAAALTPEQMIASRAVKGVGAALEVTAAFLPISILIGLLSAPAGRLADRFGAGPLMAAGSALVACAYAGLWLAAPTGQFWSHVVPLTGLAGLGLGLVVAPLTAAAMQGAEDGEQGAASGVNNAVARVAGLVAVALLVARPVR